MTEPYTPVSCALHSELEELATFRRPCTLVYRAADGSRAEARGRIATLITRERQEFVRLYDGTELRLDCLLQVRRDG